MAFTARDPVDGNGHDPGRALGLRPGGVVGERPQGVILASQFCPQVAADGASVSQAEQETGVPASFLAGDLLHPEVREGGDFRIAQHGLCPFVILDRL